MELDAAALAGLRGEIVWVDGDVRIPQGALPEVAGAIRKRHWERRESQQYLRSMIAWWAGLQTSHGRGESESYRRFYFKFGIDVGTAQTLGKREAEELADKINGELTKYGIDSSVNAELYLKL